MVVRAATAKGSITNYLFNFRGLDYYGREERIMVVGHGRFTVGGHGGDISGVVRL